jgi:hypothetical protein
MFTGYTDGTWGTDWIHFLGRAFRIRVQCPVFFDYDSRKKYRQ